MGGGRGRGANEGNCGTGVRTRISKPTPFICLPFEKMDPFIYLIVQNVDTFMYCPLIFYTYLLLVGRQISQVNSLNTKRTSSLEKSLSKNIRIYPYESRKIEPVIYFLLANHIHGSAEKKRVIRHAYPYYAEYRKLPPHHPLG